MPKYLILALAILLSQTALAAEFMDLRNTEPQEDARAGQVLEPGALIVMPDGGVTLIEEELPSGDYLTSSKVIISQDSKVEVRIFRQTELEIGARVKLPDGKEDIISEKLPEGTFKTKR